MHAGIGAVPVIELWRAGRLESRHEGHAVICDHGGAVVASWGNPGVNQAAHPAAQRHLGGRCATGAGPRWAACKRCRVFVERAAFGEKRHLC